MIDEALITTVQSIIWRRLGLPIQRYFEAQVKEWPAEVQGRPVSSIAWLRALATHRYWENEAKSEESRALMLAELREGWVIAHLGGSLGLIRSDESYEECVALASSIVNADTAIAVMESGLTRDSFSDLTAISERGLLAADERNPSFIVALVADELSDGARELSHELATDEWYRMSSFRRAVVSLIGESSPTSTDAYWGAVDLVDEYRELSAYTEVFFNYYQLRQFFQWRRGSKAGFSMIDNDVKAFTGLLERSHPLR